MDYHGVFIETLRPENADGKGCDDDADDKKEIKEVASETRYQEGNDWQRNPPIFISNVLAWILAWIV